MSFCLFFYISKEKKLTPQQQQNKIQTIIIKN
jgi:hypothetical protein